MMTPTKLRLFISAGLAFTGTMAAHAQQPAAAPKASAPVASLGATGWLGGEPAQYQAAVYVDGASTAEGRGTQAAPYKTISKGIDQVRKELEAGRSARLLIKPGLYRESLPVISGGQNEQDRSKNANATLQDTWLRIDRWGNAGDVVITGADDWSQGKGEGGNWMPVPGQPGLYSREWKRNWGLWGGSAGSANISGTAGQRREMVFVDYGDGKGAQRLTQVALEQYEHTRPVDNGNGSSWWGPGVWKYSGYAGLKALTPGSFGVTELSSAAEDGEVKPRGDVTDYQESTAIVQGPDGKGAVRKTFKELYDSAQSKAPVGETNKIFIRLPSGADIKKVKIEVSTRESAFSIESKRNFVLANLTFQQFNARMFGTPAVMVGRGIFNWWLTTGNALLDNVSVRQNNSYGMVLAGGMDVTVRNSSFDNNGAGGLNPTYCYNLRVENTEFSNTGWRAHTLGHGYTFIPGALKTWNTVRFEMDGCKLLNNAYKGFYSDAGLEHAAFRNTEFRGNLVGSMHEVARGPIVYENSTFAENSQGLAIIQTAGVKVNQSTFVDNSAAVVPEAKNRTAYDMADTYKWGDSLLNEKESPVDFDDFILTNSRLSSRRPGARLIIQGSRFGDTKNYVREITQESTFANNRYFLGDHPFAFEGEKEFMDFATWTATTGEKGALWDATLLAAPKATQISYPAGFVWNRSSDWGRKSPGESDIARDVLDANGQRQWFIRTTRGQLENAGLNSQQPWYSRPLDYMSFRLEDRRMTYRPFNLEYGWGYANKEGIGTLNWDQPYNYGTPVIEWRNPTGRPVTLNISGDMSLEWGEGFVPKVDVAIVVARADGTLQRVFDETYTKPENRSTTIPIRLDKVIVGSKDRILVSAYITEGGGSNATAILQDNLSFELAGS